MEVINRKKILYMITKGNFGGAQRYVFDLATNLDSKRFDVVVACGEGETLKEKLREKKVKVIEIPGLARNINPLREFISFFNFLKIIKEERPEVLHVNSSKAGGLGALAGRIMRVQKIIFTVHGWPFKEPRSIVSKMLIWLASWISSLLSTKTIVISIDDMRLGRMMPFAKTKIIHIYNGVGESVQFEKVEARRFLAPETKEKIWIGSIAELTKNKNLEFLIEVFYGIKNREDIACVVIGEGEERKRLERLAEELELKDKVHLIGFIKDAASYIKAFDIFVLPSCKEGHPYTILEAGIAGLPVVGTDIAGTRDIIEPERNGLLIHLGYLEAMTKALERLVYDEDLRERLGENLKKTVQTKFSLQEMLKKTTSLY